MTTSTTDSSSCCSSPPEEAAAGTEAPALAVIACGAIAAQVRAAARRVQGGRANVEIHVLPALLHDRPQLIAGEVADRVRRLQSFGRTVVVAYADCGTYGALDAVCEELGVERLAGLHCYDVFAGPDRVERLFEEEPGTYLLTDFLVQSFRRTVMTELGLDRHPELWADYFGNYRRIVWLAQRPTRELERRASDVASLFGLPLEIVRTGSARLEGELQRLLEQAGA